MLQLQIITLVIDLLNLADQRAAPLARYIGRRSDPDNRSKTQGPLVADGVGLALSLQTTEPPKQ